MLVLNCFFWLVASVDILPQTVIHNQLQLCINLSQRVCFQARRELPHCAPRSENIPLKHPALLRDYFSSSYSAPLSSPCAARCSPLCLLKFWTKQKPHWEVVTRAACPSWWLYWRVWLVPGLSPECSCTGSLLEKDWLPTRKICLNRW